MTLIIGVNTGNRIQMLSDTRISHPDVTQVEEVPGRLKLVALRPDLCVAYAGLSNSAIDIIRSVAKHDSCSFDSMLSRLLEGNAQSRGEVDFMVATMTPALRLVAVKDNRVTEITGEGWIGDIDAATEYKARKRLSVIPEAVFAMMPEPADDDDIALEQTISAFASLLRESRFTSVGGLRIRLGSTPHGFRYLPEAGAYFHSQLIPSGVPTALSFGGPAEGGFAYSLLVPSETGRAVVAAHFFQGHLGFVYAPLLSDKPIMIQDVSYEELRERVRKQFGFDVVGIRLG